MANLVIAFLFTISFSIGIQTSSGQKNEYLAKTNRDSVSESQPLVLTPLVLSGQSKEAKQLSKVTNLTDVVSYSGYFKVNFCADSNLFFWFFPAVNNPEKAPLLLWLQGGPGSSSLYSLFNGNGPFIIDSKKNVKKRKASWTETHSIIYMDSPVGTGYSFTKNKTGYARKEEDVARDLYYALIQFFVVFPEYQKNDFYVTGEGYGGKYTTALAYKIHQENPKANPKINLKGMAVASGFSDPITILNYGDFLYSVGLIDYNAKLHFNEVEKATKDLILKEKYDEAFPLADKLILGYDLAPTYLQQQTGFKDYFNFLRTAEPSGRYDFISFIQQESVRKSLHVGNTPFDNKTSTSAHFLQSDILKSVKPWMEELLNAPQSYKVLMFNGQLDISIATEFTDKFIRSLNWKGAKNFSNAPRKIWKHGNEIAGYSTTEGSLTQLIVRKAGHMVAQDQPEWALEMINRFTSGKPF